MTPTMAVIICIVILFLAPTVVGLACSRNQERRRLALEAKEATYIELKVRPGRTAELIIAYRIERNADGDEAKIVIGYLDLDDITRDKLFGFLEAITDEQLEVRFPE